MTHAHLNASTFCRVRHWKDFQPTAAHLVPTRDSLRWFMRTHDAELCRTGAILKLARGVFIDPEPFKDAALSLMQSAGHHRSVS